MQLIISTAGISIKQPREKVTLLRNPFFSTCNTITTQAAGKHPFLTLYSGMPLQLGPSLRRLFFSCMLVWMRLISKSGSLPVTGQLNAHLTYKYLFCLWILSFVVSDLQPWEIHLHKLNFARISSGGKSCFCFSTVLLVQLNEKDTFGKNNLETTGE